MIIYVTEMLRWGEDETHHYIIGAFDNKKTAEQYGDAHKSYRGGKYEYRVVAIELNSQEQDVVEYRIGCV